MTTAAVSRPLRPSLALGALLALLLALAGATALLPGAALAQAGAGRGFLFREPFGSVTLRGGYTRASAGSDIFRQVTQELTLGRRDFDALALGAEAAYSLAPRVDLTGGVGIGRSSARSEFREWVDQDDLPIEQTTTLRRVELTLGGRLYLAPRGRAVGRFAWIPARYTPFVGAGAGTMYYRFRQKGDFVDYATKDIYPDEYRSSAWAPMAYGQAGLEMTLTPYLSLSGEGRYVHARGAVGDDFEGFDRIDLSGVTASIGLTIRY